MSHFSTEDGGFKTTYQQPGLLSSHSLPGGFTPIHTLIHVTLMTLMLTTKWPQQNVCESPPDCSISSKSNGMFGYFWDLLCSELRNSSKFWLHVLLLQRQTLCLCLGFQTVKSTADKKHNTVSRRSSYQTSFHSEVIDLMNNAPGPVVQWGFAVADCG